MDCHMETPRKTAGKVLFTEPKYKKYKIVSEHDEELSHTFDFQINLLMKKYWLYIYSCHSPVRKHTIYRNTYFANNKTYG